MEKKKNDHRYKSLHLTSAFLIFLFLQYVLIISSHQGFIRYIHKSFSSSVVLKCSSFQNQKDLSQFKTFDVKPQTLSFKGERNVHFNCCLYSCTKSKDICLDLKLHSLSLMRYVTFCLFHILYLPFFPNTPTLERVN